MSNVEAAQASIRSGHEVGQQVLAALSAQNSSLEEVQNGLRYATQGSNQAEAEQANAELAAAKDKIDEARQQVAAALAKFELVAQHL